MITPLRWLAALADLAFGPLERRCRERATHYLLNTFDGSLTGGGATLQAGVTQFNSAHQKPFIAYWAATWSDEDLARVQAKRGDPAGQARLEALALLQSVHAWREIIKAAHGRLTVMGDALGVLHDARRFKAHDKVLNETMAEVALLLAPMRQDIRAIHLWTQRNSTCNLLSRLANGQTVPPELSQTPRTRRSVVNYRLLGESAAD